MSLLSKDQHNSTILVNRKDRSASTLEEEYLEQLSKSKFWSLFWIPNRYLHRISNGKFREFHLTFWQKIFMIFEFPVSCVLAANISILHTLIILMNVVSVIISSLPAYRFFPPTCEYPICDNDPTLCPGQTICRPISSPIFQKIDLVCAIVFTVEFIIRVSLVPLMPVRLSGTIPDHWDDCEKETASRENRAERDDPSFSKFEQVIRYTLSIRTAVDIVSIVPTYIIQALGTTFTPSLTFLRIFRMIRLLRIIGVTTQGRMVIDLLNRTLYRSREAIAIMAFYLGLFVLFFASIIYSVEAGEYKFTPSYPTGAYLRPDGLGGQEITNFDSIPSTIYYTIVSVCTVGYGDMIPTTEAGRALACIVCLAGIIATAMPISIISSNFSIEYEAYVDRKRKLDRIIRIRDKRSAHILKKTVGDVASTAVIARSAALAILKRHKSNIHVMNEMEKERPITEIVSDSSIHDSLSLRQIYMPDKVPEVTKSYENTTNPKAVTFNIENRSELSNPSNDHDSNIHFLKNTSYESLSTLSDSSHGEADDPSNYVIPSYIYQIISLPDHTIDRLDQNELRIFFRELRTAYSKLIQKNLIIKDMIEEMESLTHRIQSKNIQPPRHHYHSNDPMQYQHQGNDDNNHADQYDGNGNGNDSGDNDHNDIGFFPISD